MDDDALTADGTGVVVDTDTDTGTEGEAVPVRFPALVLEGFDTGDGRYLEPGGVGHRSLPLPIFAKLSKAHGGEDHENGKIVGHITELSKVDGPGVTSLETQKPFEKGVTVWQGKGVIDTGLDAGREALDMIRKRYLRGTSVDLADTDYEQDLAAGEGVGKPRVVFTKANIAGTTIVPVPAFADAYIECDDIDTDAEPVTAAAAAPSLYNVTELGDECVPCALGMYEEPEPDTMTASAHERPPRADFTNPELGGPTPVTITDDGRVFGHLATWGTCHIGMPGKCVPPPRSRTDYARFLLHTVRTDDGIVPVGKLTLGTGHASTSLGESDTVAHYDNTGTAVANVNVGEDAHGIWFAGHLVAGVDADRAEALGLSALSGDWRRYNGNLELVAALAVNTPGYPIPRSRVASGEEIALVAAGATKAAEVAHAPVGIDPGVLAEQVAEAMERRQQEREDAQFAEFEEQERRHRHAQALFDLVAGQ